MSAAAERILITGAGGFVGRHLVAALRPALGAGARIVAVGREAPAAGPQVEAGILDVTDPGAVLDLVRRVRPTCLVHLAAITHVQEARRDVASTWTVNVQGTLTLAEAVRREAPEARFLFVSSSEIYGNTFRVLAGRPAAEEAALDPANPYAATKAAADLMVGELARSGLDAVRLRPFNHTGAGQAEPFVIPAFAAQVARIEAGRQEPVIRVGNLDAERDYLHVRDVVDAYVRVIGLPAGAYAPGLALNIASGTPRRIGDALAHLLDQARVSIRVEVDPERYRPNETPRAVGDATRARALLGWEPTTSWPAMIDDVLAEWRAACAP
ncbi:GDP-mannose 4,6-dehydratase [Methylobacterium crusticola]|nr:GDP-mannose 4,6-dehydratase [Methylobacterium crusticola]